MKHLVCALGLMTLVLLPESYANEEEECHVSNLRFDEDRKLVDFIVTEPDFFFVTNVIGYKKVDGQILPAIEENQEFRKTEKGFAIKTVIKADQSLSQKRVSGKEETLHVFTGVIRMAEGVNHWELITTTSDKPLVLNRKVLLNDGSLETFECKVKTYNTSSWYVIPFSDTLLDYGKKIQLPEF